MAKNLGTKTESTLYTYNGDELGEFPYGSKLTSSPQLSTVHGIFVQCVVSLGDFLCAHSLPNTNKSSLSAVHLISRWFIDEDNVFVNKLSVFL